MEGEKQRIILAGGSGLIGTACRAYFTEAGYDVIVLTRKEQTKPWEVTWDPAEEKIGSNVIDGAHAVINLCGLPLPEQRWTDRYKSRLHDSRVLPARFIGALVRLAQNPPPIYIGASAVGIYGDHGTDAVYETDQTTINSFVPGLVGKWEDAHRNVAVPHHFMLRIGIVLSPENGFLEKVIPPTRFGLYPCFGSGNQIMSWILLYDLVRMMAFAIANRPDSGVYNATAPGSVSQKDLMRALRSVSRRPGLVFPVPGALLKIVLGEMATLLFESADVRPDKIVDKGFQFEAKDIHTALHLVL